MTYHNETREDKKYGVVTEIEKPQIKAPSMYKVVILNDDFTPMDFVVEVLQVFFSMTMEKATVVMLQVHKTGKGICGIYTKDVAETKAHLVNQFSRENDYPLLCAIEVA